jgi:hypothetical protein
MKEGFHTMVKRALLSLLLSVAVTASLAAQAQTVAAGTKLNCRLTQTLSTKTNFQNDPFQARVSEPLYLGNNTVIPVGSIVDGRIAWLVKPGRIRGVGEMRLDIDQITLPDGRKLTPNAVLTNAYGAPDAKVKGEEGYVKGPSSRLRDVQEVTLGMGGGGFIGLLIGGAHGAVVGGAIGAGAGIADSMRRRGADLTLPTGTQLEYQLTRELVVAADAPRETAARAVTSEDLK